uniref:Nucleotidyltransferase substrate binding protein, HI0074 family n=1 Tax=Candidatus Kentrum sp. MB TaxID=2138164 RepID=A0A451BFN5_9GAMM|nr:MAG: nucleotidyltransferase substrate binding protein, HI0074 family [Candidatus Kentron sp. MB]VFK77100.1 MAG: nucleotidyltransferase substrate binding protein, HI0074 family [Candidatus Kentron sp. MB]
MDTDIRWHQRLQNFDRAFVLLRSALEEKAMERFSALEQEGMIQRFQYTYELAWKTMKDYLESEGIHITPVTPRNVIKEAFAAGIIDDGQVWIDMMLHRNLLSHTYDHDRFREVLMALEQRYLAAFAALHEWLLAQRI